MKVTLFLLLSILMQNFSANSQMTLTQNLQFEGNTRKYAIYLPANYVAGSVRPLIIDFHGYGSTASTEQAHSRWMPVADTAGFLVVYPSGLKDIHQNQYWNVGWSWLPQTNDIGFVSALIDTVYARYNIDLHKVYAAGFSNGGFMAYRLGAQLSDRIAAVASVSGGIVPEVYDTLMPLHPIPTLGIHGTSDDIVGYNGGIGQFTSVHVDSAFYFWGRNNLCDPEVDTTLLPNLNQGDGSTVQLFEFKNEACEYDSRLYRVMGGEHLLWPGVTGNKDFNASSVIWNFFNTYSLQNVSSVDNAENHHPIPFSIYPVPAHGEVTIHFKDIADVHDPCIITLMNIAGELILKEKINPVDSKYTMRTEDITPGVYFLIISNANGLSTCKVLIN